MRSPLPTVLALFALLVGSAPAQASPEDSNFRELPEFWVLLEARTFGDAVPREPDRVSEQVVAWRLLLAQSDAGQAFGALFQEAADPSGQLYALCGLWLTDREAFNRALCPSGKRAWK